MAQMFPKLMESSQGETRTGTVPGSQSFPFQNPDAKNNAFETSILEGNREDNTSQESILRGDDRRINRRDEVTIGFSK
jgi:hypothetical protein